MAVCSHLCVDEPCGPECHLEVHVDSCSNLLQLKQSHKIRYRLQFCFNLGCYYLLVCEGSEGRKICSLMGEITI